MLFDIEDIQNAEVLSELFVVRDTYGLNRLWSEAATIQFADDRTEAFRSIKIINSLRKDLHSFQFVFTEPLLPIKKQQDIALRNDCECVV